MPCRTESGSLQAGCVLKEERWGGEASGKSERETDERAPPPLSLQKHFLLAKYKYGAVLYVSHCWVFFVVCMCIYGVCVAL